MANVAVTGIAMGRVSVQNARETPALTAGGVVTVVTPVAAARFQLRWPHDFEQTAW